MQPHGHVPQSELVIIIIGISLGLNSGDEGGVSLVVVVCVWG